MRYFPLVVAALIATVPVCAGAAPASHKAALAGAGADGFQRAPQLPKWAQPLAEIPATTRSDAVVIRLNETQAMAGETPAYLVNRAIQVNDRSALAAIGQVGLTYYSAYQRLKLHRVALLRDGRLIDQTASVNARSLQRETAMENGMYGGATTVQLLLDDVRVGDTLWLTYSVEGYNPVFGKQWFGVYSWDNEAPVELRRLTVLHPKGRPLHWRQLGEFRTDKLEPRIDTVGEFERLRFEGAAIEALETEPAVPAEYLGPRMLQFSEFADWQEIARWANGLFPRTAPGPALQALARQIGKEADDAARAAAALRWVQNEIRYFSVSVGENSHRPQAPEVVLKRRYGDCKDKSYLLIALLAELGIEASPVLLSAQAPRLPAKVIATPGWFDHVLVRLTLAGKHYYVDPTRIGQSEPLALLPTAFPGAAALVVEAGAQALTSMPLQAPIGPVYEVVEDLVIDDFSGAARLSMREIYRGALAEATRLRFGAMSPLELKKFVLKSYEKRYPGVSLAEPPRLQDQSTDNRVELSARLLLPKAVTHKDDLYAIDYGNRVIEGSLSVPDKLVRNFPLDLGGAGFHGRYRLNIRWPGEVSAEDGPLGKTVDNPFFRVRGDYVFRGNEFNYLSDYQILADSVAAADVPELHQQARRLEEFLGGSVRAAERVLLSKDLQAYSARDLDSLRQAGRLGASAQAMKDRRDSEIGAAAACEFLRRAGVASKEGFVALPDSGQARQLARLAEQGDGAAVRQCQAAQAFDAGDFARSLQLYEADGEPSAGRNLAWAQFYSGKPAQALATIARYRSGAAGDAAGLLALADQIALFQRSGNKLPAGLHAEATAIPDGPWPRPLLAMQAGMLSPEVLLAQAAALPKNASAAALTEAWFYIGQARLARQDVAGARQAFQWLNEGGIRSSPLFLQARAELRLSEPGLAAYQAAMQSWRADRRAAGLVQMRDSAAQGNAAAQYSLGMAYLDGWEVAADQQQALPWLRQAAAGGNAPAQYQLGLLYGAGKGVPADPAAALAFERAAAEQSYGPALVSLGWRYRDGDGLEKDPVQAVFWFERAALLGNAGGMYALARCYSEGLGVESDKARAARLFRAAAEQGHSDAQVYLGLQYERGEGVEQDMAAAAAWYRKAAEAGNHYGQNNLGNMYRDGRGVSADGRQALEWYRKAAEQGSVEAIFSIGYAYQAGQGCERDYVEAMRWYLKAAQHKHATAQYNIAILYRDGLGVAASAQESVHWCRQAAANGDEDAMYHLGQAFRYGDKALRDPAEALRWYAMAAERGQVRAQVQLGLQYLEGSVVGADKGRAVALFRQAAASGDASATYWLARCIESGSGTAQDAAAAAAMYRKLAADGVADARNQLILMHEDGRGVPRDEAAIEALIERQAQQRMSDSLVELGAAYQQRGLYSKAEAVYLRALQAAEKPYPLDGLVAQALRSLGSFYREAGNFKAAEPLFSRALLLYEKRFGKDHLEVAELLDELIIVYRSQVQEERAEPLAERALAIRISHLGRLSDDVATTHNNLAFVYSGQDKDGLAEQHFRAANEILAQLHGADSSEVAAQHGRIGYLFLKQGKFSEAQALFSDRVARGEALAGADHPALSGAIASLAAAYEGQGQYEQAEALFRRALALAEQAERPASFSLATALNNLGAICTKSGKTAEAEALLQRSLAMREAALGADHADVAISLDNLGLLYQAMGKDELAEARFARALAIREAQFSPGHSEVAIALHELGAFHLSRGRLTQAEPLLRRALAIRRQRLPGYPATRSTAMQLAALYRQSGRTDAALALEQDQPSPR